MEFLKKLYYTLNTVVRRIRDKMRGKLLIFIFGVVITVLMQLLSYYANWNNWQAIQSALKNPTALLYNIVFAVLPLLMLVLLWKLIGKEDKREKDEQLSLMESAFERAIKKALDESKESTKKEIYKHEIEKYLLRNRTDEVAKKIAEEKQKSGLNDVKSVGVKHYQ